MSCIHTLVVVDHVSKGQEGTGRPIDGVIVVCASGGGVRHVWPDGTIDLIKRCDDPIDSTQLGASRG